MTAPVTGAKVRLVQAVPPLTTAAVVAGFIWLAVWHFVPPLDGMDQPVERLVFGLKCCCVAVLLTFLTGVEAIAHERLTTDAFDPLAGRETRRLKINARYLQNTLEQLAIFVPGLLVLAVYCDSGSSMRAVVATTLVWTLARFAFWVGYHVDPRHRIAGLIGVLQSMLVLLYAASHFGYDLAGWPGAIAPVLLFAAGEGVLIHVLKFAGSGSDGPTAK